MNAPLNQDDVDDSDHVCHLSSATSPETTNFKATVSSTSSRTHFPYFTQKKIKIINTKSQNQEECEIY